jgi:predicted amidophosphoribosyltransferase
MGFQRSPQWRGETVYMPSNAPVYGQAAEVLEAVERMIERGVGLWVPVVLHWGWEAQRGFRDMERLSERIAPYAARWEDFRAAVDRSRAHMTSTVEDAHRPGASPGTLAVDG